MPHRSQSWTMGGSLRASNCILFVVTIWMVACIDGEATQKTWQGGPAKDYDTLVANLRAVGLTLRPTQEISQPFLSVKGRVIGVNGSDVQVFEYQDANAATAEAARVSPDGRSVGETWINWVAKPHFYGSGKLIVLYLGDDSTVIGGLEAALGAQFAGG